MYSVGDLDFLFDLFEKTHDDKIIWYGELTKGLRESYIAQYLISDDKRLFFRFSHHKETLHQYFSIKYMNKKNSVSVRQYYSSNPYFADDLDLLYKAIKYSNPRDNEQDEMKMDY